MSTVDDPVVLLVPEEEFVPEHALHERIVDQVFAGLAARFAERDDVAVHCRLAWFPDRSDTRVRLDPDVTVVFGRPQADRSSYRTWDEDGIPPSIMVEVWSDHDTDADYRRRLNRARSYGVEEAVLIAPFAPGGVRVEHLVGDDDAFRSVAVSASEADGVVVPRLGITLRGGAELIVSDEHGRWPDTATALRTARAESARADAERARAERLAERLRAAGLPVDD